MPTPLVAQKHKVVALRHRVIQHSKLGTPSRILNKAYGRAKAALALLRAQAAAQAPSKAIAEARRHLGEVEVPDNHISFAREFGIDGQPWCGAFVGHCLRAAGVIVPAGIVYTPNVFNFGWLRVTTPRPGDVVLFKWPGVSSAACDHIGLYVGRGFTIEGNTSSGNAGSQNNGGGVYLRHRGSSNVVAYFRPPYPR